MFPLRQGVPSPAAAGHIRWLFSTALVHPQPFRHLLAADVPKPQSPSSLHRMPCDGNVPTRSTGSPSGIPDPRPLVIPEFLRGRALGVRRLSLEAAFSQDSFPPQKPARALSPSDKPAHPSAHQHRGESPTQTHCDAEAAETLWQCVASRCLGWRYWKGVRKGGRWLPPQKCEELPIFFY